MSTEKEPDCAGIAEREAAKAHPFYTYSDVSVSADSLELANRIIGIRRKAYASCMEARLRSDWETIKMLRWARHDAACAFAFHEAHRAKESAKDAEARIALIDERISKLLEPFT